MGTVMLLLLSSLRANTHISSYYIPVILTLFAALLALFLHSEAGRTSYSPIYLQTRVLLVTRIVLL